MKRMLANLEILALDIQATYADPDKGRLLEVGWARASASWYREKQAVDVETYLIADSCEDEIPR